MRSFSTVAGEDMPVFGQQLPEKIAGASVEAHHHAAISLVFWIARRAVVRSDIDPPS
jgi:hypothetical protein